MVILVQLLPVSLAKLWDLNDSLRNRSDAGYLHTCLSCGTFTQLRCSRCRGSRYCSKVRIPIFSTLQELLWVLRGACVMIGADISLNAKLWVLFIAIIEQTGASGTPYHSMATFKEKGS